MRNKVIGQRLTGRVVKQRMVTIRQIKVLKMFDQKTFLLDMVPPQIKDLGEYFIIFRIGARGDRRLWGWPRVLYWFCRETPTAEDMVHIDP